MLLSVNGFTVGRTLQLSPRRMLVAASDVAATAAEKCSALPGDDSTVTDTRTDDYRGTPPATATVTVTAAAATHTSVDRNTPTHGCHDSRGEGPWT